MKLYSLPFLLLFIFFQNAYAQPPKGMHWSKDGKSYFKNENGIVQYTLPGFEKK